MNRGHFADALTPGFHKLFDDGFREEPLIFEQLFAVENSTKDTERDSSYGGFALPFETGEGEPITYDQVYQGYDVTYRHKKYTLGFKVTREAIEDDLYRIVSRRPSEMGRAMRRGAENQAAGVINNGFSTSYLGGDAKPLFSTSHPRPDGGTAQSNASSTGLTLTETNLETGRLAIEGQLDDRGQIIDVEADTILVPRQLDKTAHEIIDAALRSGTADNDPNYFKGMFSIKKWKYITSSTAWFLVDTKTVKGRGTLTWFWRRRPEFKNDELFDTEFAVYKSTMRLSRGWSDWHGIWGSKGDGSAYSS